MNNLERMEAYQYLDRQTPIPECFIVWSRQEQTTKNLLSKQEVDSAMGSANQMKKQCDIYKGFKGDEVD